MVSSPLSNNNLGMGSSIEAGDERAMKGIGEPVRINGVRGTT